MGPRASSQTDLSRRGGSGGLGDEERLRAGSLRGTTALLSECAPDDSNLERYHLMAPSAESADTSDVSTPLIGWEGRERGLAGRVGRAGRSGRASKRLRKGSKSRKDLQRAALLVGTPRMLPQLFLTKLIITKVHPAIPV